MTSEAIWDQECAAKLRGLGLNQDQIGIVLGELSEQRQKMYLQGYGNGYSEGYKGGHIDGYTEGHNSVIEFLS